MYLIRSFLKRSLPKTIIPYVQRNYCCKEGDNGKSLGRHRYHKETERAINDQISEELRASYTYLSITCHFGRTDVALPGCKGFFHKMHLEEHDHAHKLIQYQIMRGGRVVLHPLCIANEDQDWHDICFALETALKLEKEVKESLIGLVQIAEKHQDYSLMDYISSTFIAEQDRSIWEIARLLVRAQKMIGSGAVSEYLFDKEMHRAFIQNDVENPTVGHKVYK